MRLSLFMCSSLEKWSSILYRRFPWLLLDALLLWIVFSQAVSWFRSYLHDQKYAHYVVKSYWDQLQAPFRDGYTDRFSYETGDTQILYINYKGEKQQKIYLYNILNQKVDSAVISHSPQLKYPNRSEEGFHYQETFRYIIPDLPPGIYTWEKVISFLIQGHDTASIAVIYPYNTIQAYNITGGKSFYAMFSQQTATLSFQRPIFPAISFMVREMMKWLYLQPFEIRYLADTDVENKEALKHARLVVLIGHSEYWSGNARKQFDRFVDFGGNALILSGNTMWWKVRYCPDMQCMICYKDGREQEKAVEEATGNWQRWYPVEHSIGVNFTKGGYGRKHAGNRGGFVIMDTTYWVFDGVNWNGDAFIHVPTKEYDGTYLDTLGNSTFVPDSDRLPFSHSKMLGYDFATDIYLEQMGAAIIFQKSDSSGIILNFASTDWCSAYGIGGKDSLKIRQITSNALEKLQNRYDEREMARFWE